jgi:hypothetical protein
MRQVSIPIVIGNKGFDRRFQVFFLMPVAAAYLITRSAFASKIWQRIP